MNSQPDYVGPYRVVRLLGRGGMGTVYEGVHDKTQERVAVKIISEDLAHEQRFQRRFDAEIQTLIRLKHPNIVRVIGTGAHKSLPFYSMEFIEGMNLHQKLKVEKRIGWEMVLDWAIEIASALKQAHDFGIVHRDLKPANLMITPENNVKLVDFGISRLFGNFNATLPGATIGTADFMPPEQAEGIVATPRSDLYALGAICYACLSGRAPFLGNSVPEILFNVRYGIYTPLNHLSGEVPVEFCSLIDELLNRDPEKRPATAYATMSRLQSLKAGLNRRKSDKAAETLSGYEDPKSQKSQSQDQTSVDLQAMPSVANLSDSPYHDATRIDPPKESAHKDNGNGPSHRANRPNGNTTPEIPGGTQHPSAVPSAIANDATREHITGRSALEDDSPESSAGPLNSTYSEVSDRDRARATIFDGPDPEFNERQRWSEITLLIAALVACAGAFYYFTRPIDPASIYDPIFNAMSAGDDDKLMEMGDKIELFRQKYPDDLRIDQINAASQRVNYLRKKRQLQRPSEELSNGNEALVSALRDIMKNKEDEPEHAKRKLDTFLVAYPENLLSKQEQSWIQFAKSLREELEAKRDPEIEKMKISQLDNLIDRIMSTELPLEHEKHLRALIELYGQEPWAVPVITKANEKLKKLMPKP